MAPIDPHWKQPSHPEIQEVVILDQETYSSKSLSKIDVPPFGVYAKLDFPPCSRTKEPTYATVQSGRDEHLNLNSDLLYINHSCEPSLIFDLSTTPDAPAILAGPAGLAAGEELSFFYPSTEWAMAQPFDCLCGKAACRGRISGARDMTAKQLEGMWLNGWIRELRAETTAQDGARVEAENGLGQKEKEKEKEKDVGAFGAEHGAEQDGAPGAAVEVGKKEHFDEVEQTLVSMLKQARIALRLAEEGLSLYRKNHVPNHGADGAQNGGEHLRALNGSVTVGAGNAHAGPTSRELSGEMGGDTVASAAV